VPFPARSAAHIADAVEAQLKALLDGGRRVRFALLDHISSQPALLLPVRRLVQLCRQYGTERTEIAVDGAHSVGSCAFDVRDIGADWFFSNLHKWGFAPSTATIVHAARAGLMRETGHPVVSWGWGAGLAAESPFPGTRDCSAMLAVPAAMSYLAAWRSPLGETSHEFCRRRVLGAARELAAAWGTEDAWDAADEELVATQAMVRLPPSLHVNDVPGQPGVGVRAVLRDRFGVEAAIGNFGGDVGAYVRLSFAVYNTQEDIDRLRDAILQLVEEQRHS